MVCRENGQCPREAISRSEFGVIVNDERLARVAIHPIHFTKSGQLKPAVIPIGHLNGSSSDGLSLTRCDRTSAEELNRIASEIAGANVEWQFKAVIYVSAEAIRQIRDQEQNREICLYDDPVRPEDGNITNEAHALARLCFMRTEEKKHEVERLRMKLLDAFSEPKQINEIYPE
jgi:hypothetical protein